MSNLQVISVHELKNKLDNNENFTLIDVRESEELAISKINEALHIPMSIIPTRLTDIDSTKPIIIMCKSGGRSAQVCQYLNDQGYTNVYNLNGGIISWALEIDPNMATY
tara:strand:+ start:101 stop:427 length:327 start_codon:yes stop_codon:yes gene_type:complete